MRVVAYPFHDWNKGMREGFRTRDGHILQQLGHRSDVDSLVVINRPRSRVERWLRPDGSARNPLGMRTFAGARTRIHQVGARTYTVDIDTPDVAGPVQGARDWWFDVFSRESVASAIRWALAELDALGSPALAWTPTVAPALLATVPSRFVFDSLDNWLIHPMLRRSAPRARAAYASLLPTATAVFVAAPRSAEVLSEWRPDVRILPNGVESDLFRAPTTRPADLPVGQIVGYAGKLAQRIDTELVVEVANRMPQLQFVFVGPVLDRRAVSALRRPKNIHVLGDRHYQELPAYVQRFHVAWIPHRVGEGETGGDPIKLYEYWAAGKPVVSTPIDGMQRWSTSLSLVSNSTEACRAIRDMLAHPVVPAVPPDREWSGITEVLLEPLRTAP